VTEKLASQTVRNLAFLSMVFDKSGMLWEDPETVMDPPQAADDEFRGVSEDEQEVAEEVPAVSDTEQSATQYLLSQLAAIIRREPSKTTPGNPRQASTLIPKTSALQLLAAMCDSLSLPTLQASSNIILSPLVHLTSPDLSVSAYSTADYKTAHEELVKTATELQDSLRGKLGTTIFIEALQNVNSVQRKKADERRTKRRVDAVARPEVVARKRTKRAERDKERRREINAVERGRRRGW